jgi:hypothetical protein
MQRHKIYEKLNIMYSEVTAPNASFNETQIDAFMCSLNKMDTIITDSMLHSEKTQCKRRPPTMYLVALDQANLSVQYWNVLAKITRQRLATRDRLIFIEAQFTSESNQIIAQNTLSPGLHINMHLRNIKYLNVSI